MKRSKHQRLVVRIGREAGTVTVQAPELGTQAERFTLVKPDAEIGPRPGGHSRADAAIAEEHPGIGENAVRTARDQRRYGTPLAPPHQRLEAGPRGTRATERTATLRVVLPPQPPEAEPLIPAANAIATDVGARLTADLLAARVGARSHIGVNMPGIAVDESGLASRISGALLR